MKADGTMLKEHQINVKFLAAVLCAYTYTSITSISS